MDKIFLLFISQDDGPYCHSCFDAEMTLVEQVFRKMGYTLEEDFESNTYTGNWVNPNNSIVFQELPPISSSWEVCAKYLVPFMENKEWAYSILNPFMTGDTYQFRWEKDIRDFESEIKDDNIALAACEAFMEVVL